MHKIKNGLLLVTFDHITKNGTNKCWFKFKSASLSYLSFYWRAKKDFLYLKIYQKLENGKCGNKIGFVTRTVQVLDYNLPADKPKL